MATGDGGMICTSNPEILEKVTSNKVAVFIDGPKGDYAGEFAFLLLKHFKHKIDFLAVHDVKYDSETAKIYRNTFTDIIPSNIFFTDDPNSHFSSFRENIDQHMLHINQDICSESPSSLDKTKGLGYLQTMLVNQPRGFGMVIIKPE